MSESTPLPFAERDSQVIPGHWLLARIGKHVLRPGGRELTLAMLEHAGVTGVDVVELAPGLGHTAAEIIKRNPSSYVGVDKDPRSVAIVNKVVAGHGYAVEADAAQTGRENNCADVVVAEAMLTMQTEQAKTRIVSEAVRLLRPGGRYAIHELGLQPDTLSNKNALEIRKNLARSIRVNAQPLTRREWETVMEKAGLVVDWVGTAPMALLEPRRNLQDEGVRGVARMLVNLVKDKPARQRVMTMRAVFKRYRNNLNGIAIVAHRP